MTGKRNPFQGSKPNPIKVTPLGIYDSLRVASTGKRNRRWEKEHQSHKVTYRGVDPKAALKVRAIADDLFVPAGEVARAVIEHALRAYEQGDLDLRSRPDPYRMRMTLFPTSGSTERTVKSTKRKQSETQWRVITTWRSFPPELKQELAALASEEGLNVPIGELVTALLRFGLRAYEDGQLNLEAVQKSGTFTLALDGRK